MQDCKINVLGTKYSLFFRKRDEDEGLKKKVERILELQPDSVHVGMCTIKKDIQKHCETIKNMTQIFKESGIEVVNGTHNSELLKKTNDI